MLAALITFATGLLAFSLVLPALDPRDDVATPLRAGLLLTVIMSAVLTAAMLRGNRRARLLTCLITSLYALGPAGLWIADQVEDLVERLNSSDKAALIEAGRFEHSVVAVRDVAPSLVDWVGSVSPVVAIGGAAWATVMLLLPVTRRDLRQLGEVRREGPPANGRDAFPL